MRKMAKLKMMMMKMKKKPNKKASQEKHQPRRKSQVYSTKFKNVQISDIIGLN
jgi:hypothetical protein